MFCNKMPVHMKANGKMLLWGKWRIGKRGGEVTEIHLLDICPV